MRSAATRRTRRALCAGLRGSTYQHATDEPRVSEALQEAVNRRRSVLAAREGLDGPFPHEWVIVTEQFDQLAGRGGGGRLHGRKDSSPSRLGVLVGHAPKGSGGGRMQLQ